MRLERIFFRYSRRRARRLSGGDKRATDLGEISSDLAFGRISLAERDRLA